MGDIFGISGIGISSLTEVQSHKSVRFLGAAAAVPGGAGFEVIGMGGGPNFSVEPTSGDSVGVRGFWALALAGFIRGGTGGGIFFGAMAAWILELSLSLNLSITVKVYCWESRRIGV